jgi:DNA topoisomerase I
VPRLRRSDCSAPGIRRRRRGKGFTYYWEHTGERVTEDEVLQRIADLVIPPAWNDVWVCPWPHGHLQAVGTDAAGRKQYRYHDHWRARRDLEKFENMLALRARLAALA